MKNAFPKLSVNIDKDTETRLRTLAFNERFSKSAIVSAALAMFFELDDATLAEKLRAQNAGMRRIFP